MSIYTDAGIDYPSVTTVLSVLDKSAVLMPWAARLERVYTLEHWKDESFEASNWAYKEVQEEALDIGSEIHAIIEKYIKFGKDALGNLKDEVQNGFLAFLEWEKATGVKWLESEMTVISKVHCFAGTLDAVAILNDKRYVIDFKSSKGFYAGYGKQIAAYKLAYEEMTGGRIDGSGVLRLDKLTGLPQFKDYTKNQDRKTEAFLMLLDFYYADKKRKLKNNPRVK